ncbi:MAG: tetratricopeptide repeat protein, partial [Tepidisphaeraceae bacterium]
QFASSPMLEPFARILIAARAVWFYLAKLIWPTPLAFIYPLRFSVAVWWYPLPILLLCVLWPLWQLRARIGRGPLVALLFFIVTLAPALGFVNIYPMRFSLVADHFQYLACVGPIALVCAILSMRSARWLAPLVLFTLTVLSWRRAGAYHDQETLWADTVRKNPASWMVQANYGAALLASGKLEAAEQHLGKSLAMRADPAAMLSLGRVRQARGDLAGAVEQYENAIALNPKYAPALCQLADARVAQGDEPGAMRAYEQAIVNQPGNAPARVDYGVLLAKAARMREAADQFAAAVAIDPNSVLARRNYTGALMHLGRLTEAEVQVRHILRRRPDDAAAYNDLGIILARTNRISDAVDAFSRAIAIDSSFESARRNLEKLRNPSATSGS